MTRDLREIPCPFPSSSERGILTHGAEMAIVGDWERGRVWFQETTHGGARGYHLPPHNSTSTELAFSGDIVPGWNKDFTALCNEAMDEAKLGEYEKHAVPRFAYLHLLSWTVAQDKGWSYVKAIQRVCTISARFGETVIGRSCACKNSPRRMEKSSLRRLRDTGVCNASM